MKFFSKRNLQQNHPILLFGPSSLNTPKVGDLSGSCQTRNHAHLLQALFGLFVEDFAFQAFPEIAG